MYPMVLGICNKGVLQAQLNLSKTRTNVFSGNSMDMYKTLTGYFTV